MRHTILATFAAAALLAGCGGDGTTTKGATATKPAAAAGTTDKIQIANFLFSPDPVTVKAGTKITITNKDSAPHTVTEEGSSPTFDSSTIKGGTSGSVTFEKPGTYKYFCLFHPTMKGTVTVVG